MYHSKMNNWQAGLGIGADRCFQSRNKVKLNLKSETGLKQSSSNLFFLQFLNVNHKDDRPVVWRLTNAIGMCKKYYTDRW